jgi:tryptophanyl-tRNA synthetase
MMAELTPIRERAVALQNDQGYVMDALKQGASACRTVARETIEEVRSALGFLKLD